MATLSRTEVQAQIEAFVAGTLTSKALAAWAFDTFYDEEEGRLTFEAGYGRAIGSVLDDLMWSDDSAFTIDTTTAQILIARLHEPPTDDDDDEDDEDEDED